MIYEDERAPQAERLGFVLHLGDFIYELVWYPEDRKQYYARQVRDRVRYPSDFTPLGPRKKVYCCCALALVANCFPALSG